MPDTPAPAAAADLDDEIPRHPARSEIEAMAGDPRLSLETRERARALLVRLTKLEILAEAMRRKRERSEG